jgi:argininosuccinate lyase
VNILRGSRVQRSSKRASAFTSSIGFDSPLSRHVVDINAAHMVSLLDSGEVDRKVGSACLRFLGSLPSELKMDPGSEDVHHSLEQQAVRAIGMEAAGYLNLGKSRNDQVASALRMEVRARVLELVEALSTLQSTLLRLAGRYGGLAIPGYTHLQRAQPVTVFHYLQSHFEALSEDVDRLAQLYARVNLSPMGSAALAGTSVRVDRAEVASLLGFDGLAKNAMFAVSSRGFALEALACAELVMVDASSMAEELILWSSSEFGFVEMGDEYSATSSIMPQKKNPVVAETIRAKCGSVIGEATAAFAIAKALPNAYNLDLQEITPHLWRALDDTTSSVSMLSGMLSSVRFVKRKLAAATSDDLLGATELANELVRSKGVPFRQAHQIVGELVRISVEQGTTLEETASASLATVATKVLGRPIKIDKAHLGTVLDALKTLELIHSAGGANPRFTQRQVQDDKKTIEETHLWLKKRRLKLDQASRLLGSRAKSYLKEVRN